MTQKLVIENFQKEYLIYKIECNMTGKIYIGHTSNLTSRINTHISSFKKGILSCSSCKILTHNDYKISVLRKISMIKMKQLNANWTLLMVMVQCL